MFNWSVSSSTFTVQTPFSPVLFWETRRTNEWLINIKTLRVRWRSYLTAAVSFIDYPTRPPSHVTLTIRQFGSAFRELSAARRTIQLFRWLVERQRTAAVLRVFISFHVTVLLRHDSCKWASESRLVARWQTEGQKLASESLHDSSFFCFFYIRNSKSESTGVLTWWRHWVLSQEGATCPTLRG